MTARVSFTRPKRVPAVPLHANAKEKPTDAPEWEVGGGPPKGNNHPLTPPALAAAKNEREVVGVEAILDLAAKLSPADRKQLLAELALLAQQDLEKKSTRDIDMWATAVYEALTQAFGTGDGAGLGPLVVKRVVGAHTAWRPVADFMEASGLSKLTVPQRQAMYRMLAKMAVKQARGIAGKTGVAVTPKFVASVSANLAAVFDLEFPGYLAAGMAPIVAKRLASI